MNLLSFTEISSGFQTPPPPPDPGIHDLSNHSWPDINSFTVHFFFVWLLLTNLLFKLKFLHFFTDKILTEKLQSGNYTTKSNMSIHFIFLFFFFATKVCTEFISVFNTIIIKWFNQKRFSKKGFPFVIPYGWLFKMIYYIILKVIIIFYSDKKNVILFVSQNLFTTKVILHHSSCSQEKKIITLKVRILVFCKLLPDWFCYL